MRKRGHVPSQGYRTLSTACEQFGSLVTLMSERLRGVRTRNRNEAGVVGVIPPLYSANAFLLPSENQPARFQEMSSVGFTPESGHEIEKLREACSSLNDVLRGITCAQDCIDLQNFGMAKDHLKAALWHAGEAKKVITALGQAKNQKDGR